MNEFWKAEVKQKPFFSEGLFVVRWCDRQAQRCLVVSPCPHCLTPSALSTWLLEPLTVTPVHHQTDTGLGTNWGSSCTDLSVTSPHLLPLVVGCACLVRLTNQWSLLWSLNLPFQCTASLATHFLNSNSYNPLSYITPQTDTSNSTVEFCPYCVHLQCRTSSSYCFLPLLNYFLSIFKRYTCLLSSNNFPCCLMPKLFEFVI